MNKSDSIKNIGEGLRTFHAKVATIAKTETNPFFKSKYADLSNILEAIKEPLQESKLAFAQFPSGIDGLTTILIHDSGEWISSEYSMTPAKQDPQGRGSAITYQRRYALCSILGLNTEDDDGNAASKNEPVVQYGASRTVTTHPKPEPKKTEERRELTL